MGEQGQQEPAALAHIERTLAETYRKEIDQEENVWRTLPFFAAMLALQLAALFQIIDKLPAPHTLAGAGAIAFLSAAGFQTVLSLGFLAASIYPRRFEYLASAPLLLAYAQHLMREESETPDGPSALVTLKSELARQYATSAAHNRRINERRERRRFMAGLAALGSVLATVFLVVVTYAHYVSVHAEGIPSDAALQASDAARPNGTCLPGQVRPTDRHTGAAAPADAGRH